MSSKHLTFRVSLPVFEEIEVLKPDGIKMSAFIAQLVEAGMRKPESVHEDRASKEMHINAVMHRKQYDEMTQEDRCIQTESFRLAQGQLTFNDIIEKHKEELEKKYK